MGHDKWDVESTLELDSMGASIPMVPMVLALSSYTLLARIMRVRLILGSLLCNGYFGNSVRLHKSK